METGLVRYQFQVDGRPAGPVRREWAVAAQDAVAGGYAMWTSAESLSMDDQGSIARVPEGADVR